MSKKIKLLLILAIPILACLCFYACKDWEYNVVKNGIHFKKIYQSKGGTNTGYMTDNHTIQGFPCEKGWIHFKKNWQLLSFQLSDDFIYKETLLPAQTWLHFPYHDRQSGYICSFPYDYEIQEYLCGGSGGYKGTHTGFYDSGKLRSFFPSEDVIIDGVPCEASLFANVNLYENGNIKSCKLAEDYQVNGKIYKKGKTIEFNKTGKVK
jgi:hypothetical protein